jgi:uncharacterized phiE125 gp8 family phage protein
MHLELVRGPGEEPVSVKEMRKHLRIDLQDDDDLISEYISAAREEVERVTRRALLTQTLHLHLKRFPAGGAIVLPRPPLQALAEVRLALADGSTEIMAAADFVVSKVTPAEIRPLDGWPAADLAPGHPITVVYEAGWCRPMDVPARFRQAVRLLAAHWYEQREAVVVAQGISAIELPLGVQRLLQDRGRWF